ncbi:hypothetical protein ACFVH6_00715 [Spirillospora sp. NPDC127200]
MDKRIAFLGAPLLVSVYGLVRIADGFDGERGPGLAWTTGHLAFLGALALFGVVLWEARRLAGGGTFATATTVVGFAGIVFAMAQFAIDIAVGALATDHADMAGMFRDVRAVPGLDLAVYDAGPALFYLGLLVAAVHLAVVRAVPAWSPVAVVFGVLASMVELDLLPLAGLLMLAAFAPLARPVPSPARA